MLFTRSSGLFKRALISLTVLAIAALLSTSSAMAGCNAKGKGKDCPPPNPTPASSGSATADIVDNAHDDISFETLNCTSGANNTAASGDYFCDAPTVEIQTLHMTNNFNKKHRKICNSMLRGETLDPVSDAVSFGWTNDCTDGSCDVELRMVFSGPEVMSITDDASDYLEILFYGKISGPSSDEGNPFKSNRDIVIDSLDFSFFKPGTTRSAGNCALYPEDLVFSTTNG